MAERASPHDPAFKGKYQIRLAKGILPYISYIPNPYRKAAIQRFKWVQKFTKQKRVLDVPTGTGWGTSFLHNAKTVTGIDRSKAAIEEANFRYGEKATFLVGDMSSLPFPAAAFDVISCLEGIEHVSAEVGASFIREAFRVLRPHGLLLLSSPYCRTKPHSGNPYHVHEYQPDEIKKLISEYFTIESIDERDVDIMRVLYIRAKKKNDWALSSEVFLKKLATKNGVAPSTPDTAPSLYGTVYRNLALEYLRTRQNSQEVIDFIQNHQSEDTGMLIGPELMNFSPPKGTLHDKLHLELHSTISTLAYVQQIAAPIQNLSFAEQLCDLSHLQKWHSSINWKQAWFEGNNILFVGQLLIYLRDVEKKTKAQKALDAWFSWLDNEVDPRTSLWGTQGFCSKAEAVYGGYHQLLVYWHENREIKNHKGLVDTVLSLRHPDGGFNPTGNGGACEDVDSVDILVNCYKRWDYRRPEIRQALWFCVDHILKTQNSDGGFPYNRDLPQSHMGIPGTEAAPNTSCTFPTWFRIHTLALCAEIIPDHPALEARTFYFNKHLSMGWHESPEGWQLRLPSEQLKQEKHFRRLYSYKKFVWETSRPFRLVAGLAKRAIREIRSHVSHATKP